MSEIYENIKKLRIERGLSQEELAAKMGYTSRSTIAKIESGTNDIPQAKIKAFAKALGSGFGSECGWGDLEILNNESGKPEMRLSGAALQTFEKMGGKLIHLSISHEKNYATAFVIIEGEK